MTVCVFCPKLSRIMSLMFQYFWIIPFCMGTIITIVKTEQTEVIKWNKTNPMFKKGGAHLSIPISSNLVIECPQYSIPQEFYTVYWLPERAFKECIKPDKGASLFVNCSNPQKNISFTQEVSIFSGVPGGKDFVIGQSYYIATLSTGTLNGIRNEYKGACIEYNMKLNITITDIVTPSTPTPSKPTNRTSKPPQTTHRPTTPTPRRTTERPTMPPTTTTPQTTTSRRRPITPDIPDPTDIVISVPDNNSKIIDANSARLLTPHTWLFALCVCLSFLHIQNFLYAHDWR